MDDESTSLSITQASAFCEQFFSGVSSPPEIFLHDEHPKRVPHRPHQRQEKEDFKMSIRSVAMSSPTKGLGFQVPAAEGHSVAGFKPEFCDFIHNGTLLNFELNKNEMATSNLCARMRSKQDEYNGWKDFPKCFALDNILPGTLNDNKVIHDLGSWHETSKNKRPALGEGVQQLKKQCVVSSTAKKDPLSIAAKNRRERISERLKALQELVPNGSKVDLVTMLEKAINYVKFLQLQVKVLATDEFWPSQGGKAPELSRVKEAIDAILGS